MVKRRELRNRSNSRDFFTLLDKIREKVATIVVDANVLNPELLFYEYLSTVALSSKLLLVNAFTDTLNQLDTIKVFKDIVENNTDGLVNQNNLIETGAGFLKILTGLESHSFRSLVSKNETDSFGLEILDLIAYPQISKNEAYFRKRYFQLWDPAFLKNRSFKVLFDCCSLEDRYLGHLRRRDVF